MKYLSFFLVFASLLFNSCKEDRELDTIDEQIETDTNDSQNTNVEVELLVAGVKSEEIIYTKSNLEIVINGENLDRVSSVEVDGVSIEIVSFTDSTITIKVPSNIEDGSHEVVLSDGTSTQVAVTIITKENLNSLIIPSKEILITDFDGKGLLPTTSSDLMNWTNAPGAYSKSGVGKYNVNESAAKGDYFYAFATGVDILPNTYGFVASLYSANASKTFINQEDILSEVYINLLVNFNGKEHGEISLYFIKEGVFEQNKQYAYRIKTSALNQVSSWEMVSIPLSKFKTNYGFGGAQVESLISETNAIDISVSDDFENVYSTCCQSYSIDCCKTAITETVDVNIDYISLSYGAPSAL